MWYPCPQGLAHKALLLLLHSDLSNHVCHLREHPDTQRLRVETKPQGDLRIHVAGLPARNVLVPATCPLRFLTQVPTPPPGGLRGAHPPRGRRYRAERRDALPRPPPWKEGCLVRAPGPAGKRRRQWRGGACAVKGPGGGGARSCGRDCCGGGALGKALLRGGGNKLLFSAQAKRSPRKDGRSPGVFPGITGLGAFPLGLQEVFGKCAFN